MSNILCQRLGPVELQLVLPPSSCILWRSLLQRHLGMLCYVPVSAKIATRAILLQYPYVGPGQREVLSFLISSAHHSRMTNQKFGMVNWRHDSWDNWSMAGRVEAQEASTKGTIPSKGRACHSCHVHAGQRSQDLLLNVEKISRKHYHDEIKA